MRPPEVVIVSQDPDASSLRLSTQNSRRHDNSGPHGDQRCHPVTGPQALVITLEAVNVEAAACRRAPPCCRLLTTEIEGCRTLQEDSPRSVDCSC